jgi:methylenetetrahydrofolate reductase (NADPH)
LFYDSDIVVGQRKVADFKVSVSAYPECHAESPSWDAELDNLKCKVEAGVTRVITQFSFEADTVLRFWDRIHAANTDIPIVHRLMPQPNFKGQNRMSKMCGVNAPNWYGSLFEGLENDAETRILLAASLAIELTASLVDNASEHFHLYALNRAELALSVSRILGLRANRKTSEGTA